MTRIHLDLPDDVAAWARTHPEEAARQLAASAADDSRELPAWPSEEARLRFRARMRERLQREPTPEARRALEALRREVAA